MSYTFDRYLARYLARRWDPQNYDEHYEAEGRRAGLIDLDSDIGGIPTDLLLRTLERLHMLGRAQRAIDLDTFIYED